jgi:ribosomal protein L12E/L44/L45/RPP1/RPP2
MKTAATGPSASLVTTKMENTEEEEEGKEDNDEEESEENISHLRDLLRN